MPETVGDGFIRGAKVRLEVSHRAELAVGANVEQGPPDTQLRRECRAVMRAEYDAAGRGLEPGFDRLVLPVDRGRDVGQADVVGSIEVHPGVAVSLPRSNGIRSRAVAAEIDRRCRPGRQVSSDGCQSGVAVV